MSGRGWLFVVVLVLGGSAWAEGGKMETVVQRMFESANASDEVGLMGCFSENALVEIVTMEFRGKRAILSFFQRDVWGGTYTVERSVKQPYGEDVELLFQPAGWERPEPPILYSFFLRAGKIERLVGKYR